MAHVTVPLADGSFRNHQLGPPADLPVRAAPPQSREVYAAAHVVADPLRASMSAHDGAVDWEATLRQRHRLWNLGLGVAEAMEDRKSVV